MRRSAGHVGQETLLQQPAGRTIPDVAKPLRCRLRLHNWEHRETPRPKSATRSVFAVTHTGTEGMQPRVLAQLESPAQASVEGYPSCAVQHRVQQHSRFSVSASWSVRVRRRLDKA
jgi:hypothetical protein